MNENTASSTAFTVMQGILYVADYSEYRDRVPENLSDSCRRLLSTSVTGQKRLAELQNPFRRRLLKLKEKLLLPGIALHYVMRKRFIEDYVTEQIAHGAQQVINLGAGFDTLMSRLAKQYPHINFIEVDHPATQTIKLQSDEEQRDNFNFLPMRFDTDQLNEELLGADFFSRDVKTIYIIEGVLMYLCVDDVKKTFDALKKLGNNDIKIIFTAAQPFVNNPESIGLLFSLYLKLKGEPLAWMCDKTALGEIFSTFGFTINGIYGANEFIQRYLPSNFKDSLQTTEYIAIACPDQFK
ncbi:MAG: methyltransferase (TIGR00027 family) [Flavobacteriales bacterium]|jgi:methyltransferase (TIGR00027 family)